MPLQVTGQSGQGLILPSSQKGGNPIIQTGLHNEVLISELLGKFASLVYTGNVFGVTYASGALAAASATATGPFALFNPNNSGKLLMLLKACLAVVTFTPGTTGAGFGIQAVANQQPTTTTPGNTPQNALIGSGNVSIAKTFTAGTLVGAPTAPFEYLNGAYLDLAAADITLAGPQVLDGSILIQPGSGICLVSSGTLVTSVVASLYWGEIPV